MLVFSRKQICFILVQKHYYLFYVLETASATECIKGMIETKQINNQY